MRTAVAQRADKCAACGQGIHRGDRIALYMARAWHLDCVHAHDARTCPHRDCEALRRPLRLAA